MPRFTVWLTQADTSKAWFDADSTEQAIEILEKLNSGEMSQTELTNLGMKLKNVEVVFDPFTLEAVDE
jgi:hypothetical protein